MSKKKKTGNPNAEHYVNNDELVIDILSYKANVLFSEANGNPKPQMGDALGEKILRIATRLSLSPNFRGYTYRDEMVSDGVENCLLYITNFDPNKSNNAFAYLTQIIYFAFLRRIYKEKRQQYIKLVAFEQKGIFGLFQDLDRTKFEKQLTEKQKELGLTNADLEKFKPKPRKKSKKRKKL